MKLFHTLLFVIGLSNLLNAQNFVNFPYTFGTISLGGTNAQYATLTTDRLRILLDKQTLVRTGRIGSFGATTDLVLTTNITTRATIRATDGSFGLNVSNALGMMHVRNTTAGLSGLHLEQTVANGTGLHMVLPSLTSRAIVVRTADSTHFQVMGDGRVFAREIEVKLGAFPDYVFGPEYRLMTLPELKAFIYKYRHLPGLPTAQQVAEQGVGLGELSRLQTEKIEELTLHVIQLNERIESLEAQNAQLKTQAAQIEELMKQVEALRAKGN